jgi:hypothetical protein
MKIREKFMSEIIFIIGRSGIGKTTSIRTLNPEETFLITTVDKRLPFKGSGGMYRKMVKSAETNQYDNGNLYSSDDAHKVQACMVHVNNNRPEIKNLILDDYQYILSNEFMRTATDKKTKDSVFEKYNIIASNAWHILSKAKTLRDDLTVFIMCHTVTDDKTGFQYPLTIGRMLGDKAQYEGYFELVLHAVKNDTGYGFLTNMNDKYMAKSPLGMFDDDIIPNDLQKVKDTMNHYYNS